MKPETSCSICGGKEFSTYNGRELAICNKCGCLERMRALFLYLKTLVMIDKKDLRIIECASYPAFKNEALNLGIKQYTSFDVNPRGTNDFIGDITKLYNISNDSYDVFITVHVLEHIKELQKALIEMKRVVNHGGLILTMLPFEAPQSATAPIVHDKPQNHGHVFRYNLASFFGELLKHKDLETHVVDLASLFDTRFGMEDKEILFISKVSKNE